MLTLSQENKIFKEACNGFGFTEMQQAPEGTYCTGCCKIHKRPTKMYSNRTIFGKEILCKFQVVRLYNPQE